MKKILVLVALLGFTLIFQGCAIYPPYGHASYNNYNYGNWPNRNPGWGGHHGWNGGGNGGGGHHGWGHGHH